MGPYSIRKLYAGFCTYMLALLAQGKIDTLAERRALRRFRLRDLCAGYSNYLSIKKVSTTVS